MARIRFWETSEGAGHPNTPWASLTSFHPWHVDIDGVGVGGVEAERTWRGERESERSCRWANPGPATPSEDSGPAGGPLGSLTGGPCAGLVAVSVVLEGGHEVLGDVLHLLVDLGAGGELQEDLVLHHDAARAARRRGSAWPWTYLGPGRCPRSGGTPRSHGAGPSWRNPMDTTWLGEAWMFQL